MCNDEVTREVNSGVGGREEIKQQDNAQTTFLMRWLTSVPHRNVLSVGQVNWDGPSVDWRWSWWFNVSALNSLLECVRNTMHRCDWCGYLFYIQTVKYRDCLLSSVKIHFVWWCLHAKTSTMPSYSGKKTMGRKICVNLQCTIIAFLSKSNQSGRAQSSPGRVWKHRLQRGSFTMFSLGCCFLTHCFPTPSVRVTLLNMDYRTIIRTVLLSCGDNGVQRWMSSSQS